MGQIEVDCDTGTNLSFSGNLLSSLNCPATSLGILACISSESCTHIQLLMQAQLLLSKNNLYETINRETNRLSTYQPTVFSVLTQRSTDNQTCCEEEDGPGLPLLSAHRDVAISSLRFLSIFYNTGPNSFYVAANLLDCLLSKIVVVRKALPIVASCCFYLATCYTNMSSRCIDIDNLMKLTQCEVTKEVFRAIAGRIRDEVGFCQQPHQHPVTPLSFLRLFFSVFELQDERLQDGAVKTFLISRLELLLCHFEFTKFRYDLLALAFVQYFLQQIGFLGDSKQLTVLELRYYCQMDEDAYRECLSLIGRFTFEYETQPAKRPNLKLTWTISRRVLLRRRPSLLVRSNLEPVTEEESPFDADSSTFVPHIVAIDARGSNGDESSGCQMERNGMNAWKKEICSLLPDDQKNMAQQVLPADDAVPVDKEILYDSSDQKYPNGLGSGSDTNGEHGSEICDTESETGDFNDRHFNLNESNSAEVNDLSDMTVSERAKECGEQTRSRNSFLALELATDGESIPLTCAEVRARGSFESPSSIAEGENGNRPIVTDDSAVEMNGRNVSTGNEAQNSKVELFSDDNNNFIVGII